MFHNSIQSGTHTPRKAKRRRGCKGFTLIEAVLSIVILSVAIPPMVWSVRESHIQRVNPMMASQARWLAASKLEDIIADRHSTTRGYAYVNVTNYPGENPVPGYPGFSRAVAINETGADLVSAGVGYKTVSVSVSWTDATWAARTVTFSTVLTEYPDA